MEHITEQYGQTCNDLILKDTEYEMIDKFLTALGCRTRVVMSWGGYVRIQADNPYFDYRNYTDGARMAEYQLSPEGIELYKR